ncbi:type VI secretion system protein TssA [Candidatus Hepatobacter penaei]|uniref:type VI secretion system protein TssA n=1 Tax=Candidatus Hepatobacter penaei TaxID=1274402 RepID=UPI0004F3704E|nr:type VI secretion system protein TssA [Candidatus Hepatobacter penaei]
MTIKNLQPLLKKISPKNPCGENLRYTAIYDELKTLRKEDKTGLPQGAWQEESPKADWYRVERICMHALSQESKDLQIALWLTEAWFFLYGLEGLFQGTHLTHQLLEHFWDSIHPQVDDPAERAYLLEWLSRTMSDALLEIPISQPDTAGIEPYTLANYIDAQHLSALSQKQRNPGKFLEEEGRPLKHDVQQSIADTKQRFYEIFEQDLFKSLDALNQLDQFFYDRTQGAEEALLSNATKRIKEIIDCLPDFKKIAKVVTPRPEEPKGLLNTLKKLTTPAPEEVALPEKQPDNADHELTPAAPQDKPTSDDPSSRQSAYALLKKVALYLCEHDPQSPVPHLLTRIHSWENKSFPEIANDFDNPKDASLWLAEFCKKKDTQA